MKLKPEVEIRGINGLTVGDFWSWAYSDIRSNRNRGIFAEYLVGTALGVVDTPRVEWDGFDLSYRAKRIEVKSSGYLQSWQQSRPSTISFDIAPKQAWDAVSNTYAVMPGRISDCYVFCLHAELKPEVADVLDVRQWKFQVVSTSTLKNRFGDQKTIRLGPLAKIRASVAYEQIKSEVDAIIDAL